MDEVGLRAAYSRRLGFLDPTPSVRIALAVFVVAALAITLRRYTQFEMPAAWVEDGRFVVPHLINDGPSHLLAPQYDYLIVPSKLVSLIALKISFVHYAIVSSIVAVAVQAACVTAIACAPSILPGRLALAATPLLLPIYPEPFALPLYVFWWTSLFVFVGLFWGTERHIWLRQGAIALGGLSSPIVVFASPLFVLRAVIERTRSTAVSAATAIAISAVQVYYISSSTRNAGLHMSLHILEETIRRFFGHYTVFVDTPLALPVGIALVSFLLAAILQKERRYAYLIVGLCLGGMIASSIGRTPVDVMHSSFFGPRYFFFPFIMLGWCLVTIASRRPWWMAAAAGVFVFLGLLSLPPRFFGKQEAIVPWPTQVAECLAGQRQTFEIQLDGNPEFIWPGEYTQEMCQKAASQAIFN